MRLKFIKHGKIAGDVVAALRLAWIRIRPTFPLHKHMTVHLVPAPLVGSPDGKEVAFGMLDMEYRRIYLGAKAMVKTAKHDGHDTRKEAIGFIVQTFCHELAHVEQDREGKKISERGIEKRQNQLTAIALDMPEGSFENSGRSLRDVALSGR